MLFCYSYWNLFIIHVIIHVHVVINGDVNVLIIIHVDVMSNNYYFYYDVYCCMNYDDFYFFVLNININVHVHGVQ